MSGEASRDLCGPIAHARPRELAFTVDQAGGGPRRGSHARGWCEFGALTRVVGEDADGVPATEWSDKLAIMRPLGKKRTVRC